jgi:hypothetical protein
VIVAARPVRGDQFRESVLEPRLGPCDRRPAPQGSSLPRLAVIHKGTLWSQSSRKSTDG